MAAVLKEHDLTHVQFVLLANVWWLGDGPTQRRLAEHAGTDPMMTSQVLRTLEGKGLVTRVVEAADASFFAAVPRADVLTVLSRLGEALGEPGE
jgi:DNA-binding MarR family transcriptional regulator